MKRIGSFWPQVTTFENLLLAWHKAKKGKAKRDAVAKFSLNLEAELFALQQELNTLSYQPRPYTQFWINDRKPRLISAAHFRDRVVQHAIMNVIEMPMDKRLIHDCYACRTGKGTHKAVGRFREYQSRYTYVLRLDVKRYFPSVNHQILKNLLQKYIKDRSCLTVFDRIINSSHLIQRNEIWEPVPVGTGIPIGNLTSQFFANLYLNPMDQFIKNKLNCPAYLRYMDDMALFSDCKATLHQWHEQLINELQTLKLELHPKKQQLSQCREKQDVFGYITTRDKTWVRNSNGYRYRQHLTKLVKRYHTGRLSWHDLNSSVQSWIGYSRYVDSVGLRKAIFSQLK